MINVYLSIDFSYIKVLPLFACRLPSEDDPHTVISLSWLFAIIIFTDLDVLKSTLYWRKAMENILKDESKMFKMDCLVAQGSNLTEEQFAHKVDFIYRS